MPRYVKGDQSVETPSLREGVRLKAQGFREVKARTKAVRESDEQAAKPKK